VNLDSKDKRVLSDIRVQKAHEFLDDARAMQREGRHRSSVNRSYYAALSGIRSLLALEGADPGTHEGALTLLSLKFVKPGLLPVEIVKRFKLLLSRRTDVDYGDFDEIGSAEAEDSLGHAEQILAAVERVRSDLFSKDSAG